jgi:phosphatidylinositol alpha-mannosyltransferase
MTILGTDEFMAPEVIFGESYDDRADVFSFGIVLVEAMAAGTPVVASNLDAFRRVLEDGAAGLLVPIEDPGALAEAVVTVLTDDTLRAGNVAAASEAVRQYDWQVVADDITMVYETVAGSGVRVVVGT